MSERQPLLEVEKEDIQRIIYEVTRNTHIAAELLGDPNKNGGYFCLLDIRTGVILITTIIGSVDPAKAERYKRLAEEKALRLYTFHNCASHLSHVSSRQSQNEAKDQYPGSILGDNFIYSFSGFPSTYDEAISLSTAFKLNDMTAHRAEKIMHLSSPRISEMMAHPARDIINAMR